MKPRPILFSAPMIRALLEGRKTQTRRIVKNVDALPNRPQEFQYNGWAFFREFNGGVHTCPFRCPYGAPGDLLWVRESLQIQMKPEETSDGIGRAWYPATHKSEICGRITPSIHMPRWASRLTLEITDVRVERLQDISEADAVAEGATSRPKCHGFGYQDAGWSMDWSDVGTPSRWGTDGILTEHDVCLGSAQSVFGAFINQLHGGKRWNCRPEAPLWDQNPWVWALTFKVHQCNVDALLKREAA